MMLRRETIFQGSYFINSFINNDIYINLDLFINTIYITRYLNTYKYINIK